MIGDNHKGETLYFWETSSGLVWKGFGDKDIHPKYKGDVVSSKPNGLGILLTLGEQSMLENGKTEDFGTE